MSSPYTFAASVGEALLSHFREYAKIAIAKGDVAENAVYEKVIHGLKVAAPQAGAAILDELLVWRGEMLSQVGVEPAGPISVLHKRLIIESFFLEAVYQIVNSAADIATHHQLHEIQNHAFDWIINGEKYIDARNTSMHTLRDKIMSSAAHVLGAVSEVSLDSITERFVAELRLRIKAESNSPARQELYNLCHGLRHLRLTDKTSNQVRSSANFLEVVFPLRHVAPDKKSRLQQAIADMMTSVLTPLVDDGNPAQFGDRCDPNVRKQWFTTISLLRTELVKWTTKQAKQAYAGLPAVTALTCLTINDNFLTEMDQMIEILHRQLRDKKNVSVVLLCITRAVQCFYHRMYGHDSSSQRSNVDVAFITRWTEKVVQPIVHATSRGQLTSPEQLELLRKLATVVTSYLPEYGIKNIILELLMSDMVPQPWEAAMGGLMSMMSVLVEAPRRVAGRPLRLCLPPTASALEGTLTSIVPPAAIVDGSSTPIGFGGTLWFPDQEACDHLLEVVKHNHNPLEAYGVAQLMPLISAAIGKILRQCHQLHGYTRLTNAARPSSEINPLHKMSALTIFVAILQVIPFIVPDNWVTKSIKEDLPGYTIHAEPIVRNAAIQTCKRCLIALPASRELIISSLAVYTVHLQEEFVDVIKESMDLLLSLILKWNELAISERKLASSAGQSAALPALEGMLRDVSRVEASLLTMLCSVDVEVRRLAIKLLEATRMLHRTITLTANQSYMWSSENVAALDSHGEVGHAFPPPLSNASRVGDSLETIEDDSVPTLVLPSHFQRNSMSGRGSTRGSISHVRRSTITSSLPTGSSVASRSLPTPAGGPLEKHASFSTTPDSMYTDGGDELLYAADVIEKFGDAFARRCYWDFGPWGDIWRDWRPVPKESSFLLCMSRIRTNEDSTRWARILCELSKEIWYRCEKTASLFHADVVSKLLTLSSTDSAGRQTIPVDGSRGELARNFVLCAAAAPYMDSSLATNRDQGMSSVDFVRLLVSSARTSTVDSSAVLGLGCIHPSCHATVAFEVSSLAKEYVSSTAGGGSSSGGGGARTGPGGGLGGTIRSSRSGGARKEDIRLVQAHILRILASNLLADSLSKSNVLKDCFVEFVTETARYITLTVDVSPELQQLRFCLCGVSRACADHLAVCQPQSFPPMLRKQLFDKFSLYCEDGQTPGLFRSELRRHISAAKAAMKGRDADLLRHLETDIVDASEMLEHAAYLGMAAMLTGTAFDANAREPQGRVFVWIDRMLTPRNQAGIASPAPHNQWKKPGKPVLESAREIDDAYQGAAAWGPPKSHAADTGLRNLLQSNTDLAGIYADRSYSLNLQTAASYFLVLSNVYSDIPVPLEEHIIVSLVLHKIIDTLPNVRHAAQAMLKTMAMRHWTTATDSLENGNFNSEGALASLTMKVPTKKDEGGVDATNVESVKIKRASRFHPAREAREDSFAGAVVVGSLAESHQAFQQHLSSVLARDHAELAHNVVREVLVRQHQCQRSSMPGNCFADVLLCLPPWLEYAAFHRGWEGQWGGDILRMMYSITATLQKGSRRSYPVQKMWMTIASNRRNVFPTVDFLLKQGVADAALASSNLDGDEVSDATTAAIEHTMDPGKQIALYLSRVAPRQVIDLLIHEATLQLVEPDDEKASRMASHASPWMAGQQVIPSQSKEMGDETDLLVSRNERHEKREQDYARIKEFHHKASSAPLQAPLPRQQPLAAHAAAAVAAATSGSSRHLTPASIAQAIKRSAVDLVIKTGVAVADTVAVAGAAAVGTFAAQGLSAPDNMPIGLPRDNIVSSNTAGPHGGNSMQSDAFGTPFMDRGFGATQRDDDSIDVPLSPSAPEPPRARLALTRPEVALCLLSEIACERDEEFRPHLAQLLHVAVLNIDSINPVVRIEASQLLQHVLYSLSYRQLESQYVVTNVQARKIYVMVPEDMFRDDGEVSSEYARVTGIIGYLQSMVGESLWNWELPTLARPWITSAGYVAGFVQIVADCFPFDTSLRERWSDEALKWACCAASRHAASRSHQIFCALGPSLSSKASTALLASLAKCLHNATAEGLDTAVELLCTLRVLLDNTPRDMIALYPHLLPACVALLNSSVVRIGELAYALLMQLLTGLDLSSPTVQQSILAVLPLDFWDGRNRSDGAGAEAIEKHPIGRGGVEKVTSDSYYAWITASEEGNQRKAVNVWLLGQGLLGGIPDIEDDATAGGPWLALQQLFVKGLLQEETVTLALNLMAAIARQITIACRKGVLRHWYWSDAATSSKHVPAPFATQKNNGKTCRRSPAVNFFGISSCAQELALCNGGIEAIIGPVELGLVISFAAALPWICVHYGEGGPLSEACRIFLHDFSLAIDMLGLRELSGMLNVLYDDPPYGLLAAGYLAWLPDVIEMLCIAFFPTYARLFVQRLMETASRASLPYQEAALAALKCIFQSPEVDLGSTSWYSHDSHLVDALSNEVGGPLGPHVLALLQSMADFEDSHRVHRDGKLDEVEELEWRFCVDDLGEGNKVCSEALRRVVEACPGVEGLAAAISLPLPNLSKRDGIDVAHVQEESAPGPGEQLLPFLPPTVGWSP